MRSARWGIAAAIGAVATASLPFVASPGASLTAQVGADVWLEAEPDYYRRGDHLNVRFSVPRDSYVAIVHVDSDGALDFLFPRDPWEDHFVRGGRAHSLPIRSAFSSTLVRGQPGIGYLYLIASPRPLDFGYFAGRSGSLWDWGYAGRQVYGDPFLAFDQITRLLVPGWPYGQFAYDYHSYYVEGIHRYPAYACSDRAYGYGWGLYPDYGPCGRIDAFLREYPYYYDTRRYRGDRRTYLRRYDRLDPRYGYKEDPDGRGAPGTRAPAPAIGSPSGTVPGRDAPRRAPEPDRAAPPASPEPRRLPAAPRRDATVPTREPAPPREPDGARGVGSTRRPPASRSVAPTSVTPASRAPATAPADPAPRGGATTESRRPAVGAPAGATTGSAAGARTRRTPDGGR